VSPFAFGIARPLTYVMGRQGVGSEMDRMAEIIDDQRPWGWFRRYTLNEVSTVKVITVRPGHSLSEQRHRDREELWVSLDDGLEVRIGDLTTVASVGDEFFISKGETHRMSCVGQDPCRVLEIAFGQFEEDDIERLSDDYGRSGS